MKIIEYAISNVLEEILWMSRLGQIIFKKEVVFELLQLVINRVDSMFFCTNVFGN